MVTLDPPNLLVDPHDQFVAPFRVFITDGQSPDGFDPPPPLAKLDEVLAEKGYESGASHGAELSVIGLSSREVMSVILRTLSD